MRNINKVLAQQETRESIADALDVAKSLLLTALELVESEGDTCSSGGCPRPVCNWVHLTRHFLGLKTGFTACGEQTDS